MPKKIERNLDSLQTKVRGLSNDIKSLKSTASEIEKQEKINGNTVESLTKKRDLYNKAVVDSKAKIQALKEEQAKLDGATDDASVKKYEKLSSQIVKAQTELAELTQKQKECQKAVTDYGTEAQLQLKKVADKADTVASKMRGISTAAAALAAGIVAAGLSTISTLDDIATESTKLDITAEEYQKLSYVATQTDVSTEKMAKAFAKAKKAIGAGLAGESNSSTKAIEALGVSISELPEGIDGFYKIAEALANVQDSTKQTYYASQIFGEELSGELLPFIRSGADDIKEYVSQIEKIGVVSNENVAAASELDNKLNELKQQFAQILLELGQELFPVIESCAEVLKEVVVPVLQDVVRFLDGMNDSTKNVVFTALLMLAAVAPMAKSIGGISKAVSGLIGFLRMLTTALTGVKLAMAEVALVGAAVGQIINTIANWGNLTGAQRTLKLLAAALFIVAAAMLAVKTAANWVKGIAIAAAIAGVVASIVALSNGLTGASDTTSSNSVSADSGEYDAPAAGTAGTGNSSTVNNDNSTYTVNVYVAENEYVSAEDLTDVVAKKLAVKLQARK